MTLQQACNEARDKINSFEQEWLEHHKQDPENYPLEISEDNSGIYFEQIIEAILD